MNKKQFKILIDNMSDEELRVAESRVIDAICPPNKRLHGCESESTKCRECYEQWFEYEEPLVTIKGLAIMVGILAIPIIYMLFAHNARLLKALTGQI